MSFERRKKAQKIRRRVMDWIVSIKQALPTHWYQSPPAWIGYVLILPGVFLVGFLFVGLIFLVIFSFLTSDPIELYTFEFTTESWRSVLTTEAYYRTVFRTLGMAMAVTVLAILLAFPYAYLTVRTKSGILRKALLVCIFVPFFTGVIVRAYGWMIILGENGLVNMILGVAGIGPVQFIGTRLGVFVGLLQIYTPFAILMLAPAIQNVDRSIERAASSLGSTRLETFRYIVLPLAAPGIAGATIVVFTLTSATYAVPELIGGQRVDFVANVIYRALFELTHYPLAAVFSLLLIIATSIILLIIFRTVGEGTLGITGGDARE